MKALYKIIDESLGFSLTKIQVDYIKQHFDKCTVEASLDGGKKLNLELFYKEKYPYSKLTYKDDKDSTTESNMCLIYQDELCLNVGKNELRLKFKNADFKVSNNKTIFTFKLMSERFWAGFKYLTGEVKFIIPTDIKKLSVDCSKFDCKKYDKFMQEFLSKKVEYFRVIDPDDIIDYESHILNDKKTLHINIRLEVGKGYSTHYREETFSFEWKDFAYMCINNSLYDNNMNAQIARKYVEGVERCGCKPLPEKIDVHIEQELD